jgi:hypothetical protein
VLLFLEVFFRFVLGRFLPALGRRHLGRVPLPPLGAPVLEPDLPTQNKNAARLGFLPDVLARGLHNRQGSAKEGN